MSLKTLGGLEFYISSASDPSVWAGRSVLLFSSTATRFQEIKNCCHIALTKMQVQQRLELDYLWCLTHYPLSAGSWRRFPPMLSWIPWLKILFRFMIKIYVSMLSYRVNFFSASPSLMDTIQSKLHAIWFPNTPFPMSVSSLLLSKAQIDLDKINAKPAWNMWRQPILCT